MLLKIAVAAFLVGISWAQGNNVCSKKSHMKRMLKCMAYQANGRAGDATRYAFYENEFYTAMNQAANSCEESSGCDMGISQMEPEDFLKKGGILHSECPQCWVFTHKLMKMFTSATNSKIRACIRKHAGSEIMKEIIPCVRRETGIQARPFSPAQFPDFDYNAEAADNLEAMIDTISYAVAVYYKNSQQKCGPETSREFLSCFDDMPSYNLGNHCAINNKCKQDVLQKNRCSIDKLEQGTCACFQFHREQAKRFAANIIRVMDRESENGKEQCAEEVYKSMVSPETGRNLLDLGINIFSKCSKLKLDMMKLLGRGCNKVRRAKENDEEATDVATIIKLVDALIDALTQRVSRFCNASACGGDN